MKRAVLCCSNAMAQYVYAMGRLERLRGLVDLYPEPVGDKAFERHLPAIADAEVMFSTWSMPHLTAERLDGLAKLRIVFYAAGSVKSFARPVLERGIRVVSAWRTNAIPVAEFTLAQILLSTKGYFANSATYRRREDYAKAPRGGGNFEQTVALLGVGAIGGRVVELLRPFQLNVVVFDPYLGEDDAKTMGVERVSLEEAFARGIVVSNHLADVPETVGMLSRALFASMPKGATFINTGRGAQVREAELTDVLRDRTDLFALLDVTHPEPPAAESPLWTLPNVKLTTHIAGSIGNEVVRMADLVMDEFARWESGQPLEHEVTLDMLDRMA